MRCACQTVLHSPLPGHSGRRNCGGDFLAASQRGWGNKGTGPSAVASGPAPPSPCVKGSLFSTKLRGFLPTFALLHPKVSSGKPHSSLIDFQHRSPSAFYRLWTFRSDSSSRPRSLLWPPDIFPKTASDVHRWAFQPSAGSTL